MAAPPLRLLAVGAAVVRVEELLEAVAGPELGGVVSFTGLVRDHDEGRSVRRLEYVAHPTAERELQRVAERVSAGAPGVALAAVHRTGWLEVGEVAVAVAAAAAHRAEAFAAARRLIDDLKEQVPIWKRQVFSDGTEEWVGAP